VSNHHVYHAKHHVFTIKKPRFHHAISQKPLQKTNKTSKPTAESRFKKK